MGIKYLSKPYYFSILDEEGTLKDADFLNAVVKVTEHTLHPIIPFLGKNNNNTSTGRVNNVVRAEEVVNVGGKVLCQDCTQGWNEWISGAKPIKGCKVSVTCMDERSRVIYYGSDLTDDAGDFDMTINKYINGKKLNSDSCFLRLISSPDPVCNIATNFSGGRTGVKLGRPTVVYRDMIKHVLGPFYYTTPMCDEPDTSESDDESNVQGNY